MFKSRLNRPIPLAVSVLFAGGIALVIGNVVSLWANMHDVSSAVGLVDHTRVVSETLSAIEITLLSAELGQRSYFLTRNLEYEQRTLLPDTRRAYRSCDRGSLEFRWAHSGYLWF